MSWLDELNAAGEEGEEEEEDDESWDESKEKQEEDPDWKETGEFIVNLKKKRCCSLGFAKIVEPESRMEGYGVDHTEPNIDLEHLSVSGHVVDTGLWGPLAAAHEEVEPVEDDADSDDESDGSLH